MKKTPLLCLVLFPLTVVTAAPAGIPFEEELKSIAVKSIDRIFPELRNAAGHVLESAAETIRGDYQQRQWVDSAPEWGQPAPEWGQHAEQWVQPEEPEPQWVQPEEPEPQWVQPEQPEQWVQPEQPEQQWVPEQQPETVWEE